jgi:feruloyl esterase
MRLSCSSRRAGARRGLWWQACQPVAVAGLWMLLPSVSAFGQEAAPVVSCESLATLALPDTTITTAERVAAGEFKLPEPTRPPTGGAPTGRPPGESRLPTGGPRADAADTRSLPAFCRVAATLKPTSDSSIRIEVWLPVSAWNGKFMGVGGGGWAGSIMYAARFAGATGLIDGLRRGYATATTDSGHDASKPEEAGGRFTLGHPEKIVDYGYRAVHLMTARGKEITTAFYGVPPRHAYFFGASRGGYEAVTEAMRFPEDYDGIAAAWPPNPFVLFNAAQLWANWLIAKDPSRLVPQSKYPMVHEAVLKACDELDGAKDRQLDNPLNCHFDPGVLLCQGADGPECLTAPQVELLRKTYQGPVNPRTGEVIFPGPAPGNELGEMYSFATGQPRAVASEMFKYVVFQDPDWDWKTLNWDSDIDKAVGATAPMLTAYPRFKRLAEHGGKLMMLIAWVNYHNPKQLIEYYEEAVKDMGAEKAADSLRLFTIPGLFEETMFDKVKLVEDWVEKGRAPEENTVSYYAAGKLLRTRPLCAYPKVVKYEGTGSTDDAGNFVCAESTFH